MTKYTIRGKHNDISDDAIIGNGTVISSFVFIGKNVVIGKNCNITNHVEINSNCILGDDVNLQSGVVLNSGTIIENNVMLSISVHTADEKYMTPDTKSVIRKPCYFESGCKIGVDCSIVSSKIGRNSVIGAKSLVLHDIPHDQVWSGNPAKFHMTRKEFDKKFDELQKKKVIN